MTTTYFGLKKTPYQISDLFKDGGEAWIYKLRGDSGKLAKIYKGDYPILNGHEEKLCLLVGSPLQQIDEVAWPSDVLYDTDRKFCGFIMPKKIFGMDLGKITAVYPTAIEYSKRIKVAWHICDVLDTLHSADCIVGDFSPANIGVYTGTCTVVFMDADSYYIVNRSQNKKYPCVGYTPDYAAPELLQCENDCKQKYPDMTFGKGQESVLAKVFEDGTPTFTQETDYFALAVHIFTLLMNGQHPYFAISKDEPENTPVKDKDFVTIQPNF